MPLPSSDFLAPFPKSTFIETGSHRGDGIQTALDAGYTNIYSVEVSAFSYGWCCHRFRDCRTVVNLFHGESRPFLRKLRDVLTTRSIFWLDAHWCGGEGEMEGEAGGDRNTAPLLEELRIISTHRISHHVILIDDVHLFGELPQFPTLDAVKAKLRDINPEYNIHREGDILVAEVEWE